MLLFFLISCLLRVVGTGWGRGVYLSECEGAVFALCNIMRGEGGEGAGLAEKTDDQ